MITITEILECERHLQEIDAVIFDLDDTLYSEKDYVRSGYRAVARVFTQVTDMEQRLWDAFQNGLQAIDAVLEQEGILTPEYKEKALQTYRRHLPEVEVYPGVHQLLLRLGKSKRLGLITDGRPEGQRAKLQALAIENLFDEIIVTDELGGPVCRKPNEAAFRLMQQAMGVPFEKMVYVGDNAKKDFIAPEKLGMQTIWFRNRDGLYTG